MFVLICQVARRSGFIGLSLLLAATSLSAEPQPRSMAKLVLVIDDIGNNAKDREVIALPGAVTLSILPFTPHSKSLAEQAFLHGKEVLLHMPMASKGEWPLGEGALTREMNASELQAMLLKALVAVPHVVGVNNHMGSDLTESLPHMVWTMQLLRYYPLFFLDSRTSVNTCAEQVASDSGVPALRRHIFLDNEVEDMAISRQFDRLLSLAKREGYAIGIGHPYPETLRLLQARLPELEAMGVELVSASALIDEQRWLAREQVARQPLAVTLPQQGEVAIKDDNSAKLADKLAL